MSGEKESEERMVIAPPIGGADDVCVCGHTRAGHGLGTIYGREACATCTLAGRSPRCQAFVLSGRFYVHEIKTSSEPIELGEIYWKRITLDPQISLYIKAVRSLGFDVIGVLYSVLRKPDLRPLVATPVELRKYTKPTKKDPVSRLYANQRERDETPEEYGERCLAAIAESPEKFYQRGVVTRLADELDEASRDVWQTATAMRDAKRLKIYPRNPDSCIQWSRTCDYLSVCCGEADISDPVLFRIEEKKHPELDDVAALAGASCGSVSRSEARRSGEELLTQSSLRCYRSCPRKYFYRYELQARPLAPDARPLRTGKSVHAALEMWSKTGGDLQASLASLSTDDPYDNARARAMVIGYHARWGSPEGVVAVEKEWTMELVNPDTGAASKTFRLGGRVDSIVRAP